MCMFSSFGSFGSIISAVFQRFAVFASSSDCARRRSSCSRSSGVSSAPKSSASNTWRISTSVSSLWGLGQRLTHSIASSFDFTCHSQKPASSSLVSAKGPSITLRLPPENLTRALGARVQPLAREHYAGFHQLFVELAHFGQKLFAWHYTCFRVLGGFNQDHESHFRVSYRSRRR